MKKISQISIDSTSKLFDKTGLHYIEFGSDFQKIRYYTLLVVQKAPIVIKDINLLEQQISEIIKNAVKHGNKSNPLKKVHVWYSFTEEDARIIVEDEGSGFNHIEAWNEFNRARQELLSGKDGEALSSHVAYHGPDTDENDGGNALFGAVEYWNGGLVFNDARNCVAAKRLFPGDSV